MGRGIAFHDPAGYFSTERCIEPDAYTTGTVNGQAIDLTAKKGALFIFETGTVGSSGTIDGKLQSSADGSTGWADITGKAITQITASDPDGQVLDYVPEGAEDRFVRAVLTVAVATSDCGVAVATYS